jgi:hypothetical protein
MPERTARKLRNLTRPWPGELYGSDCFATKTAVVTRTTSPHHNTTTTRLGHGRDEQEGRAARIPARDLRKNTHARHQEPVLAATYHGAGVAIVVATARPGRGHAQRKDNTREGATKVAAHQRRRERPWTDLGVLEIEQRRRERKGYARPPGNGRRPACREGSRGEERVGTNRRGDDASREKERGRAMGA